MMLIEELLRLLEDVYDDGMQASLDPMNDLINTASEASQKALEKLKLEIRQNVSLGDERQIEDPRYHYIDVQVEKDFYAWLWGDSDA